MNYKRFVIDTNVLVSSIAFTGSSPDLALRKALTLGVLVFSHATIAEFKDVILRPKFDRYISRAARQKFIFEVVTSALLVEAKACEVICRDANDQKFLEVLAEGEVDYLISGDQDLFCIKAVGNCHIVSPTKFLRQFS